MYSNKYMNSEPFETQDLKLCGLITIVGKSGSGKTTLLRSIINKLYSQGLYKCYVFSSTADIYRTTDYDFAAPENVRKINMKLIKKIKLKQEVIVKKASTNKLIEPRKIAIVLDDFIGDSNANLNNKSTSIISQLAVSGRHYKITLIVLTQHLNKAPPVIRLQSNYIFVTKTNMSTITECIFPLQTQYLSKKELWDVYNKHTNTRYSSMMIQDVDPYADNIKLLQPAKKINFIDDPIASAIIADAIENQSSFDSEELKSDQTDDPDCSDN